MIRIDNGVGRKYVSTTLEQIYPDRFSEVPTFTRVLKFVFVFVVL